MMLVPLAQNTADIGEIGSQGTDDVYERSTDCNDLCHDERSYTKSIEMTSTLNTQLMWQLRDFNKYPYYTRHIEMN